MLAWLALMACALPARPKTPAPTQPAPPAASVPSAQPPSGAAAPAFAFGVEYMLPGLAATYAQLGARWVRSSASTFSWGTIEPQALRSPGQHDYRWDSADRLVREWQEAGFGIQIQTNANNAWASSQAKHHVPDPDFLDDWEAFVLNLVERYDHDGDRDMPGLKAAILDYTVVEEWTGYFTGTVEEYLQILSIAHRAIKRANPDARVRLVDLFMIDVFDGNPSPDEVARRAAIDHVLRHPMSEVQELLRHPDLFDIVEVHALGDYTELYATADWLRGEMGKNGYRKPLWIGDALAVSSLIMSRGARGLLPGATDADFYTVAPIRPHDAVRTIRWLEVIKDARAAEHEPALAWWRALQASDTVKKLVVAIHAGYAGMNYAWLADSPLVQLPRITGSWGYQGLVDGELDVRTQTWRATAQRPAFHTYKLAIAKLDGYTDVERLDLAPGSYAYRFLVRGRPVYVLWRDPGRLYFPDEEPPAPVPVRLPFPAAQATVTHLITGIGQSTPRTEVVAASAGHLTVTVGPVPIFVETAGS